MMKTGVSKKDWLNGISFMRDGKIEIEIPFLDCSSPKTYYRDYTRYDVSIACEDLPEMPLDGNPRGINIHSPSFKAVKNCVSDTKTLLQQNHNGGDIFANYVEVDPDRKVMKLTFCSTGMGVINGATSMGAVLLAKYLGTLKPDHVIEYRVRDYNTAELSREQRLACVEEAAHLNSVVEQKEESLFYQRGYFDDFITEMWKEYRSLFIFKPDEDTEETLEKGYNSNYILRLCEAMHVDKYKATDVPTGFNSGVKKLRNDFGASMSSEENPTNPYGYLVPMINDFITLYGHIEYHWSDMLYEVISDPDSFPEEKEMASHIIEVISKERKRGYHTAFSCMNPEKYKATRSLATDSIVWCIYTSFRANINYDSENFTVGWKVDPYVLWERSIVDILKNISDSFEFDCKTEGKLFINQKKCWRDCYNIVANNIIAIQKEQRNRNHSLCA